MEFVTRDFSRPESRKIWFKYPLHELDEKGSLKNSYGHGDPRRNLKQNKNGTAKTQDEKDELLRNAFEIVSMGNDKVPVRELAEFMTDDNGKVESKRRELYRWLKSSKVFSIQDGLVLMAPYSDEIN